MRDGNKTTLLFRIQDTTIKRGHYATLQDNVHSRNIKFINNMEDNCKQRYKFSNKYIPSRQGFSLVGFSPSLLGLRTEDWPKGAGGPGRVFAAPPLGAARL